jgi:HSP20 family protein
MPCYAIVENITRTPDDLRLAFLLSIQRTPCFLRREQQETYNVNQERKNPMADEKFDPIKEFTQIRDTLSRTLEQGVKGVVGANNLLVDIYETANDLVVRTSPIDGAQPNTIEVSVENGVLTISVQTTADTDIPTDAAYLTRERRFGTLQRGIRLPRPVQSEAAQAKFKNGVLTVILPKVVDDRPQVIEVTPVE